MTLPAISTVHAVLDRHGLVTRGRRHVITSRPKARACPDRIIPTICGAPITRASSCSPIVATAIRLTITDFASRYLLCCDALETTKELYAFTVFERTFKDFGLPRAIRSDNGVPFASNSAFFGLSKLSVWWLRLGIAIERIKPANPQQNGRHERMHLTLKKEATKPPGKNFLQQQAKFDAFIHDYNQERPHQALNMRYPAELYSALRAALQRLARSWSIPSTIAPSPSRNAVACASAVAKSISARSLPVRPSASGKSAITSG